MAREEKKRGETKGNVLNSRPDPLSFEARLDTKRWMEVVTVESLEEARRELDKAPLMTQGQIESGMRAQLIGGYSYLGVRGDEVLESAFTDGGILMQKQRRPHNYWSDSFDVAFSHATRWRGALRLKRDRLGTIFLMGEETGNRHGIHNDFRGAGKTQHKIPLQDLGHIVLVKHVRDRESSETLFKARIVRLKKQIQGDASEKFGTQAAWMGEETDRSQDQEQVVADVAYVTSHLGSLMFESEHYGRRSLLSLFPEREASARENDRLAVQTLRLKPRLTPRVQETDVYLYQKRTHSLWEAWGQMIAQVKTAQIKACLTSLQEEFTGAIERYVKQKDQLIERIKNEANGDYASILDIDKVWPYLRTRKDYPDGKIGFVFPDEFQDRESAEDAAKANLRFFNDIPVKLGRGLNLPRLSLLGFHPFNEDRVTDEDAYDNAWSNIRVR